MEEEKFSVQNDNEMEVKGIILRPKRSGKFPLVILSYDILETADSSYLKELTKGFMEKGFAVCRFDFTHGFGKSSGKAEHMTVSQRARDLEFVIEYAKRRAYIIDTRITILGFGFGAMAALVLEGFHDLTKAMVLVNTPCQIDDIAWTRFPEREMMRIRLKRYFHLVRDGAEVRINYTFYEDGYKLDMFRCARNLRTPVLYLSGSQDEIVRSQHSDWLYERTNAKKEREDLPDLGHTLGKRQVQLILERTLTFFKKQRVY